MWHTHPPYVNMVDRNNVGTNERFLGSSNIITFQHIYIYGKYKCSRATGAIISKALFG